MNRNSDVTRRASHAGSWYSSDPKSLDSQIQEWIQKAQEEDVVERKHVKAIIAPHAGYSFSGPIAAFAYQSIEPEGIKHIFILGPSHHHYLESCAVTQASTYATPFGNLDIDEEINAQLLHSGLFETMSIKTDEDEHSIEMHLPFVAKLMEKNPQFTIIPILVGSTTLQQDKAYASILAPYFHDPATLFIISSDFCHWGQRFRYQPTSSNKALHEYIKELDFEGMKHIENTDVAGFHTYCQETKNTICGRHPISLLLQMLQHETSGTGGAKAYKVRFIKYAQSSACLRLTDSSVSYATGIVV